MAIVSVTFTNSEEELISGIPRFVEISTNEPSTIYYTLDGSLPTLFSSVYTEPIVMPSTVGEITLSAVGYYLDGYSTLVPTAILTNIYRTDQSDLDRTRYIFFEGLVYSYPGGQNIPIYYDYAGEVSFSIDIPADQLYFIESDQDELGNPIELINAVTIENEISEPTLIDNSAPLFATPNGVTVFNPNAKVILIDGRDSAAPQSLTLLNGPYMSLRNPANASGGIDFFALRGSNYISGSATKYFVNRETNIAVFYYMDNNSGRWVKSIQPIPSPATGPTSAVYNFPLVFKWINFGRQMGTY